MLVTTRGTSTEPPTLTLISSTGHESLVFQGNPKDLDGDFITNPIQALAMDPQGTQVLFATFDKASSFKLQNSGGFGTGGFSVSFLFESFYRKRDFRGLYFWSKTTGKCELLWDSKSLDKAIDAWRDTPEGKAFRPKVKFFKAFGLGSPIQSYHLTGGTFLVVAGNCAFEVKPVDKSIRPLVAVEDVAYLPSWRLASGGVRLLGAGEEWDLPRSDVRSTLQPFIRIMDVTPEGKVADSGTMKGSLGFSRGASNFFLGAHRRSRWTYRLDEKPALVSQIDRDPNDEWVVIHTAFDGNGYYLLEDKSFGEDTLLRRDAQHKEMWRFNLGKTPGTVYVVEALDQTGFLILNHNDHLRRVIVDRATGKTLSDQAWDLESAKSQGLPLTFSLINRMTPIQTSRGLLVFLPANGGFSSAKVDVPAWTTPTTKWTNPTPELGGWYTLGPDLILHPVLWRPLMDQCLLTLGETTVPFGVPLHAGIRTESHRYRFGITKEERNSPLHFDARNTSNMAIAPDMIDYTSPLLRAWAEQLMTTTGGSPYP